jgi:hypothetical protein
MSAMDLNELLRRWSSDDISSEMAMGHAIQHIVRLNASIDSLKETVARLRIEAAATTPSIAVTPTSAKSRIKTRS